MNAHRPPRPGQTPVRLAIVLLLTGMLACSTYHQKIPPVPLPGFSPNSVEVEGAQMAARAYPEPKEAEQAFGFDIRGAGLLPVRLVIDNRGRDVIKVNPQQTFLIDRQGMAWPLLTAEQAQGRVVAAVGTGETLKGGAISALWGGATAALSGFAIGLILQNGYGPMLNTTGVGVGAGAFLGGGDGQALQNRIRQDLNGKSLRNQRLQPGELAQGYLFFPGQDEARSANLLRLGLEMDGYPYVVNLSLAPPPAPAKAK
ncbi:hypothetical protein [Methylomagnum ishizawai]|uniref:hypothetical protein n=1 Tax=Methylomagnum ishizawai TaxID=1760988 RepID=UPI001C31F936|nr:hypothetical protein [Methylomagnum ishizawai]BBL73586.1 lipoprotein [Methylomagnum ishizawai]